MNKIELIIDIGLRYLGLPYIWGGENPLKGFDCSGFVLELLKSVGLVRNTYDTTSLGLYNLYSKNEIKEPERGCLVFFGKSKKHIVHIGLMINEELMLEAGGGSSKVVDRDKAIKYNAYVKIRPYKRRKDVVAFCNIE